MKELSEVPDYSDLKREVEALRKRIEDLESGRMHPQPAGHATRWRWLAAKPALALTAVMGAVLALGVLSAQNKQDPLFIDPNGNVSIGSARFSKIGINQDPLAGQKVIITADGTDVPFNVTDKSNTVNWLTVFKDGNVVMKGGNVGDEKKTPKLEVSGSSLLSNGTGSSAFPWTDGNSYVSGTNVILRSGAQSSPAKPEDGNTERMRITSDGKVGIGKTNPDAPLDVKGEIRADTLTTTGNINGEKPPLSFQILATGSGNHNTVVKDIGDLCGDEDGCRIKLLMHNSTNGEVKTITEEVYIGHPGRTKYNGGLGGYTRQSGGGEYANWRLDTDGTNRLFDPWQWCMATNFIPSGFNLVPPLPPGTPTERDKSFRGDNKYKIAFSCHPHVMGTFIIYDR